MEAVLVLLIIFIAIAILIAQFFGKKRQIGFGWSLFFCVFLGPLIGFIVVMLSRKYYEENPQPSVSKKIWGWILIILFALSALGGMFKMNVRYEDSDITALTISIGFIGLGYYLIELGKGKNFNTESLTKTE